MLIITPTLSIPESELAWHFARAGGPGGQNVNKVASKAELRWTIDVSPSIPEAIKARLRQAHPAHLTTRGEFLITSQKYRDQERNREDCLEKLATMLRRAAVPPRPRTPTKPTLGSKIRRLTEKKHQSTRKAQRKASDGE